MNQLNYWFEYLKKIKYKFELRLIILSGFMPFKFEYEHWLDQTTVLNNIWITSSQLLNI